MVSHSVPIPSYPGTEEVAAINPIDVVQEWAAKATNLLSSGETCNNLSTIFVSDAWLRDSLTFSWDLRTLRGLENIQHYLQSFPDNHIVHLTPDATQVPPVVEQISESLVWITSILTFDTPVGRGKAVARLVQPHCRGPWKALYLYTALQEIKGSEESIGVRRPRGGNFGIANEGLQPTWEEARKDQKNFVYGDPDVVIIGAGQAGLSVAARLQSLGLRTLIVDKNPRVGDNWRNRYRTLVTHDPVEVCHLPYLPFPATWPLYTPKDKLADWFEAYASALELNVWTKSFVKSATYDDEKERWNIELLRGCDGESGLRTLHPKDLVMATGHAGEPKVPSFPGQQDFKGMLYHARSHEDASKLNVCGKRVVVVGTGNSGHDIAQDFYENGADVTMLQRGGTNVFSASAASILYGRALDESIQAPDIDTKDLLGQSLPIPVQFSFGVGLTEKVKIHDAALLQGLTKAGFALDFGADDAGVGRQYLTRGGGYYIDVGCSQLIIDGKIKTRRSLQGIKGLHANGLILGDDSHLDADIVVLATGYDNMRTTVRKVLGDVIADRCKDIWDLDNEGEMNAVWRPSGHPGFWYMAGNLALCRPYSKTLALQIKAIELGLNKREREIQEQAPKSTL